jgi:ATP-dependent exoDNAse (exonuclease V) beta subunit
VVNGVKWELFDLTKDWTQNNDVSAGNPDELGDLAAESSRSDDYLALNLAEIARFVEDNTQLEAVRGRDYDGLEAKLREFVGAKSWKWKGTKSTSFGALSRDEVLSRRDHAKADLDAFIAASDADLAPLLHEELQAAVSIYQDLKAKAGQLDFLDLLIKARDLIRDNGNVRAELQQRFTHYFVDEFQDTDPLQAESLLLLAANDSSQSDWRKVQPVPGTRVPGCGPDRSHAHRLGAYRTWARRTTVDWAGGTRTTLPHGVGEQPQRGHPSHLHAPIAQRCAA